GRSCCCCCCSFGWDVCVCCCSCAPFGCCCCEEPSVHFLSPVNCRAPPPLPPRPPRVGRDSNEGPFVSDEEEACDRTGCDGVCPFARCGSELLVAEGRTVVGC